MEAREGIQTHLENLFQLLRLIDPEAFSDFGVFERQLEANQPVARALSRVRVGTRRGLDEAAVELKKLGANPLTAALTVEPFFRSLLERLEAAEPDNRRALIELQRDIGELSLTSGAISRTRKVDVMRGPADPQVPVCSGDHEPGRRRSL